MSLSGSQTVRCVALCHCAVQIYVEVERAHLTLELAKMKEEEGDIEEAARVLQELQVRCPVVVVVYAVVNHKTSEGL